MNTHARKLNLIENLIHFQDEKSVEKIEKFFASLYLQKNSKTRTKKTFLTYKKGILSVSVWTDKDIESLEYNLKSFSAWKIEKW